MPKQSYNVRWSNGGPSLGNVSFEAASDAVAIKEADRLGQELGLSNTLRTLYCGNRAVNESMKTQPSAVATFLGEEAGKEAEVTVTVNGTPATVQRAIKQLAKKPGKRPGAPGAPMIAPKAPDKAPKDDDVEVDEKEAAGVVESLIAE